MRCMEAAGSVKTANDDQKSGVRIIQRALEEPLRMIVANADEEPSVIVNEVRNGKGDSGYNAQTGKYGNMVREGVLDPTKVTRSALQNAASIAGLILTMEAAVAELPKKEAPPPPMPGGMDM